MRLLTTSPMKALCILTAGALCSLLVLLYMDIQSRHGEASQPPKCPRCGILIPTPTETP